MMSQTFSVNKRSVESLKPSSRWGLSQKVFQIRPTVDFDSPDFLAMLARDQWVAFFGVDSRASMMTCSTWSMLFVAGLARAGLINQSVQTFGDEAGESLVHGG